MCLQSGANRKLTHEFCLELWKSDSSDQFLALGKLAEIKEPTNIAQLDGEIEITTS